MTNKIGDSVRILCLTHSDMSLELIQAQDRKNFTEKEVTEHVVKIVGVHQTNAKNIICLCDFDPHSYFSFKIGDRQVKSHDVDVKFLNYKAAFIHPLMIWAAQPGMVTAQINLSGPGGERCAVCPRYTQYVVPNLPDGSFICRSCRLTKMYKVSSYLRANNINSADVDWIKV